MSGDAILVGMHEVFDAAARYFSVLGEPARLKILHAICGEELSVNSIIAATGMAQANASRHLGLMYQAGMLSRRREGTQVFYKVADHMFVELCRTVSAQISSRMGLGDSVPAFPLSALEAAGMPAAASGSSSPSKQKEKASV
jgi:DNA-binding transcriptional ArsR family regulator